MSHAQGNEPIFCLTCLCPWNDDENEDWNEYAHSLYDGAHYPAWSSEQSEERSIMESLIDGTWS